MSKRKSKRPRTNRHHLIFQRCHYAKGYAKALRQAFVYDLDVEIHEELHARVLHDVPRPPDADIKAMYLEYEKHREVFQRASIIDACEWLMTSSQDPAWRGCMKRQLEYLRFKLGG